MGSDDIATAPRLPIEKLDVERKSSQITWARGNRATKRSANSDSRSNNVNGFGNKTSSRVNAPVPGPISTRGVRESTTSSFTA